MAHDDGERPPPGDTCAACGRPLDPEIHYLMRVEFISTPDSPTLNETDPHQTGLALINLLRDIESLSEEELSDSVYCKVEHWVCTGCRGILKRHLLLPARIPAELLDPLEGMYR